MIKVKPLTDNVAFVLREAVGLSFVLSRIEKPFQGNVNKVYVQSVYV